MHSDNAQMNHEFSALFVDLRANLYSACQQHVYNHSCDEFLVNQSRNKMHNIRYDIIIFHVQKNSLYNYSPVCLDDQIH